MKNNTNKKAQTLSDYISHHGPMSDEQATTLLMPVMLALRDLHNNGRCHLQVSPARIHVSQGAAVLDSPTDEESARYSSGFAAPEVYFGRGGIAADVYSMSAVLYFASTGVTPKNALVNAEAAGAPQSNHAVEPDSAFQQYICRGMDQDQAKRYATIQELIYALSAYNTGAGLSVAAKSPPAGKPRGTRRQASSKKRILVPACILVLVLLVAAGYYLRYSLAVSAAVEGRFLEAKETLILPGITKLHDSKLLDYIDAGNKMENKQYDEAEVIFQGLNGYRDSEELVLETQYRHAGKMAENGQFKEAVEAYNALADAGYKDADANAQDAEFQQASGMLYEDGNYNGAINAFIRLRDSGYDKADPMISESHYLWGLDLLKNGEYNAAITQFEMIPNYQDSNVKRMEAIYQWGTQKLNNEDYVGAYKLFDTIQGYADINSASMYDLTDKIYQKGQEDYRGGNYASARDYFKAIDPYLDTDDYLFLIKLKNNNWVFNLDINETYARIAELIGFEDAASILISHRYLYEPYLEGTWETSDGRYNFSLLSNELSFNLPHEDVERNAVIIQDGVLYFYNRSSSTELKDKVAMLTLLPLSKNSLYVYCWYDGNEYTLYRQ